jgi:cysteinyl-tRNA synthetase
VFPHHENELAQSACAFHRDRMANVWMHNGFLQVEGDKMSKSTGNFVTIRELLEKWNGYAWPGEALRFNMLRTHYRQPIDWTIEGLDESHKTLWAWYGEMKGVKGAAFVPDEILAALSDDLNSSGALAELHSLRKRGHLEALKSALSFMGFSCELEKIQRRPIGAEILVPPATAVGGRRMEPLNDAGSDSHAQIASLIAARTAARARKDFKESDRIRDELAAMGVVIKDSKEGTTWEIAR